MKKETTVSIWTHIITTMLAVGGGLFYCKLVDDVSLQKFLVGFCAVALSALIIFLIFAIPIEREWLAKKSLLWKCLTWFDDEPPTSINICSLPGMIGASVVACVIFVIGNIVMPIANWQYINTELRVNEISAFPKFYIGGTNGVRFRLWMIYAVGGIGWVAFIEIKWLYIFVASSISIVSLYVCLVGSFFTAGLIWLAIRFGVFKSIWNLVVAIEKKICIVRQIPEE